MSFSSDDERYMSLALAKAKAGYERGDFPVGAVLTIDGNLIGSACNGNNTVLSYTEHAESRLLETYSAAVKNAKGRDRRAVVVLYTTLEPCLMCLGTSILGRVDRLVYAYPDPNGGAAKLTPAELGDWYERHWPVIEGGLFKEEAYDVVTRGMTDDVGRWGRILAMFEEMKSGWK